MIEKQKVAESFDRAALTYDQWITIQKNIGDNLLERVEWLGIEPEHILEVGTGTGRLTRALTEQYKDANVYAIDISNHMLTQAATLSKEQFICADAAQLPIADNSIDILVSNLMLQWCQDINSVIQEFARVLKPDGALFFSSFGPDTLQELRASWATVDDAIHVNNFIDMHHYGDSLLQAGLKNPVMDIDRVQWQYKQVKELMMELKNIGAHNINSERSRGLMGKHKFQAMIAAYEKYRLKDGLLPVTYEVIYGHALGKQIVTDTNVIHFHPSR
ncbi:malonyl-ACP O-methyltransferase BioC [Candidatus Marithrix sp. Canyon 246]|uniref:malonyl-ACP O-methyltransferase BioC n=1 Tax=Candidatus Marithrix sp. Canyon 246 TaxID=1827136 RepID=UPI00084A2BC5|nr:malonyl-ACP O-methyltransferase BioC [Candidatus Marithrix sp. Canyon 246]